MEINNVCSFGSLCHTAQILKTNNFKLCSYPFDWIFTSPTIINHCLIDRFNIFLDNSYYVNIKNRWNNNQCGHSVYHPDMFNHRDPRKNNDHEYYKRCVIRFNTLIESTNNKLFIMLIPNLESDNIYDCVDIINLNKTLKTITTNYIFLVILHYKSTKQSHNLTINNNIHYLDLHTLSASNGVEFINKSDNEYINMILHNIYKFNLINC